MVSLFIFPKGPTAFDSEPRGRRYVKNMIYNRNRPYSRAIHCPASLEMHYVQWFLLKSVYEITDCAKKLDFPFSSLGGPRHGARVWCLGRVPKHRNQWQEVEGLLFSPQNFLVSRPSAKAKEPLARSRGQWQEVEGLLFSPKNSQLVHILSLRS